MLAPSPGPSEQDSQPFELAPAEQRRNLRLILAEGGVYSLMVGIGETYLAALVVALGFGDFNAGLITTIPVLGGSFLQLISLWGVHWLRSNRRWVIGMTALQACSLLWISAMAWQGDAPLWMLMIAATLYWFGGLGAGVAWNAWIENVVPAPIRAPFFARRAGFAQACVLVGIIAGGVLLRTTPVPSLHQTFAILFLLAACFRIGSVASFVLGSELPVWRPGRDVTWKWQDVQQTVDVETRRLLVYMLAMQASVYIAAPFFTPFMLNHLRLSYLEYTWLIALGFVGKVITMRWASRVASTHGAARLLWIGGLGIVPLAAMWLVSNSLVFLSIVQIAGGSLWAFYELGTLLLIFERIPADKRVAVLSLYNLGNSAAMVFGSLLGGALLRLGHATPAAYLWVFAASSGARLFSAILMPRTSSHAHVVGVVVQRIISVRPLSGGWLRPVLPTLQQKDDSPDASVRSPAARGMQSVSHGPVPAGREARWYSGDGVVPDVLRQQEPLSESSA